MTFFICLLEVGCNVWESIPFFLPKAHFKGKTSYKSSFFFFFLPNIKFGFAFSKYVFYHLNEIPNEHNIYLKKGQTLKFPNPIVQWFDD